MPNGILRFKQFDGTDICPRPVSDHAFKGDAMAGAGPAQRKRRFRFPVLAAAALALFFLHVWTQVGPRLIHHRQHPVYLLGWEFFAEHLDRPGRLVEYAWAFLTQLHWLGWPGAAVLAALAGCTVLLARALLARMGRRADVLPVVPVVFLTVLANQYEHPMTTSIGLVAALAAATVYVWAAPRRLWPRVLLFLGLAMVLYYAAAGPMLLYASLAAIHELLAVGRESPTTGRRLVGLAYLAVGAALPWAASEWLFIVAPIEAYTRHLPFMLTRDMVSPAAGICLYAFFPLAAVWAAWPRKVADAEPARPERLVGRAITRCRRIASGWAMASAALLAVWAVLALGTLNRRERSLLYLDYFVAHGRWQEALAEARRLPTSNANTQQGIMLALWHTGRLLEDMFSYPHGTDREVPPTLREFYGTVLYDRASARLLEFGLVNDAEHIAHEALEIMGEQPAILKRLVLVNVLKGEPEAARRFLGVLDKTLWHRRWAGRRRRELDANPTLSADARIRRLRRLMPTTEFVSLWEWEWKERLLHLLRTNPNNRMAFEYLILHFMMWQRPDQAADNLGSILHFNYSRLPRHLEEAVLHHAWLNDVPHIKLFGHSIRPATVRRHQEFIEQLRPYESDPEGAWFALKDDFGDTYWFFHLFGRTPFGRTGPPIGRKVQSE